MDVATICLHEGNSNFPPFARFAQTAFASLHPPPPLSLSSLSDEEIKSYGRGGDMCNKEQAKAIVPMCICVCIQILFPIWSFICYLFGLLFSAIRKYFPQCASLWNERGGRRGKESWFGLNKFCGYFIALSLLSRLIKLLPFIQRRRVLLAGTHRMFGESFYRKNEKS